MHNGMLWTIQRWSWVLLLLMLPGCGPLALTAEDAVVIDNNPLHLAASVSRKNLFGSGSRPRRMPVTFFTEKLPVGQATIDAAGRASVAVRDLRGRPQSYQARVAGRTLSDTGRIFHWDSRHVIIAIDIDYTIVRTNYVRLLFGDHIPVSPPFPGARKALEDLAKDYYIVYLTARPRYMIDRTRRWLDHYNFPPGPIVASPSFSDVLNQLPFKRQLLKDLRQQWPEMLIHVGNRELDIDSVVPNHIVPLILQSTENNVGKDPNGIFLEDWQAALEFFRVNRTVLSDPRALDGAIRNGLTLLQPDRDKAGQYRYIQKQIDFGAGRGIASRAFSR